MATGDPSSHSVTLSDGTVLRRPFLHCPFHHHHLFHLHHCFHHHHHHHCHHHHHHHPLPYPTPQSCRNTNSSIIPSLHTRRCSSFAALDIPVAANPQSTLADAAASEFNVEADPEQSHLSQEEFQEEEEEEEEEEEAVFVMTDEWVEFFAKAEARRKLEKKLAKKKKKKKNGSD